MKDCRKVGIFATIFSSLLPILLLIGVLVLYSAGKCRLAAIKLCPFGKSRARLNSENQTKVTFEDVAGCDEAKEELKEVVEFFKRSQKIPKNWVERFHTGFLLHGSPGTGKTLLARAVCRRGECSLFQYQRFGFLWKCFVGVGASRVRDLFGAREKACTLYYFHGRN